MVWNRWLLAARTDRRGEGAHGEGRWIGTLALALALAVAGCAPTGAQHSFGNGARSPQAAPGASGRGAPEVDAPLVDPSAASAVELDAMLAYADRHAPALVVARSRRALGDAAVVAASPLLPDNPHIQLQGGPRFAGRAADVDFSVTLTQRLSVSGARGAGVAAAERFLELTEAEIEDARWVVHCDVHGAYHAALVARERAKLVLRGVTFQEGVLEVVKRQIAAGQSSPMNERLAEAELAQARQQSLAADQAYLEAKLALAELSGWPAANPPTPVGELELPHDVPPSDALFARAREHLPALRVYAAAVREAEARAGAEERLAVPEPTVGLQVTREGSITSEPGVVAVQGIVVVPLPLWQRNQGPVARARADATVASAQRTSGEGVLFARIAQHRSAVASASARVRSYGVDVLPRFDDNLKLVRRALDLGEVGLLEVSVARDRFFRIQLDALDAYADYFAALSSLERTVGVDLWTDTHAKEQQR